ncbi:bifunctional tetrahydrofolate synthase/dihydrofolate synthase [Rosenbergiella epipactidis]|uniref:bifunctional tetrahydrofolate synthase/dihydrofolate synthase n=1 Tax=Rosenbergiella epipactidis TaxID=1544694 RepID=UPI00066471EE|nr:bifunctional tetrahydrofolate synthase/dihydrofolate synthase [Rosenbergiella epipactidis]KYP91459.1 bifunctional folylpolyglutamate synthase/ dihydrofolate synthase [bacteria symbiont BFo2 of Frankliniella occidentalis]KYP92819.1 bifunctional folylpolyglutamate synthase/ dihydrofolate synthase [bacteria symbiont BFo2 of Frankliniella occidentalis]
MPKPHHPHSSSSLEEWLVYLEQLHGQAIELGLDRIRHVATELNLLKPAPFVFTVGGTNGKGTTCRTLEVLLMAAGYRVGVYSSPHFIRYAERVRINGQELSDQQHISSFDSLNQGRGETSLTFFEFSTLSALQLFKQSDLDVVILEVGLGGRLDATNIVDADVAVLTSIALDHTDWLGPDRESIGREKAGIFRQGKPAVVGEPDMPVTISKVAQDKGAILLARGKEWSYSASSHSWQFQDIQGKLTELPLPQIPLANAATALAALRVSGLTLSEAVLRESIATATLPGRFQIVQHSPLVILDVAHNPHAARYLVEKIEQLAPKGKVHGVLGMLHDKDIEGTITILSEAVDQWYCASLDGPRGASAQRLQQSLPEAECYDRVEQAWQAALSQADADDVVLVCGSFHTVAALMALSNKEQ